MQISAFLSKPFSPKELLRTIEDILYQKAMVAGKQ
jgi:DNA-binding response OmpR family regulator